MLPDDHVPVVALQVHGRHLDGQLEVRGGARRIALRRADGGTADAEPTPDSVTGHLLDGAGQRYLVLAVGSTGTSPPVKNAASTPGVDDPVHLGR